MTDSIGISIHVAIGTVRASVSSVALCETRRLSYNRVVAVLERIRELFIARGTVLSATTGSRRTGSVSFCGYLLTLIIVAG